MAQDNVLGIQATVNGKDIQQGADEFIRQVTRMEQAADRFTKDLAGKSRMVGGRVKNIESAFESVVSTITKGAAAMGVAFSAQQFVTQVAKTRGEFQQLEVAFNTMLGSAEKAGELMKQLTQTAAITPFGLQDVAGGAKQLLAYGVASEEVNDTLIRLGDIASGLSIPLNDLVYLYGTTMTQGRMFTQDLRQFQGRGIPLAEELAKQFGVTKDEVGELVTAGKVGFEEMRKGIISMTSEGGKFGGLMEAQSKTIIGQWSNIQDGIDMAFNEIGQSTEGIINAALGGLSTIVENYEYLGKSMISLVGTYGMYKAALIVNIALEKAQAVSRLAAIKHTGTLNVVTDVLTKKIAVLNALSKTNPYVLLATAVVGLGTAMWTLHDSTSATEKASRNLNEALEEQAKLEKQHKDYIDGLVKSLGDEEVSEGKRIENFLKLKEEYPKALENIKNETEFLAKKHEILKLINQEQGAKHTQTLEQQLYIEEQKLKRWESYKGKGITRVDMTGEGWADTEINEAISAQRGNISELKAKIAQPAVESYLASIKDLSDGSITSALEDVTNMIVSLENASSDAIGIFTTMGKEISKGQMQSIKAKLEGEISERGGTKKTGAEWLAQYKKEYEAAEKALTDFMAKKGELVESKFKSQYEDLVSKRDAAKKKYEDFGGSAKSDKKELEAEEDKNKALLAIKRKNEEERIAFEKDKTKQREKQIELDYQKEIDAYEEAKKKYGETEEVKEMKSVADEKKENALLELKKDNLKSELSALYDYLKEYGTIQQQKYAIAKEYDMRIAEERVEARKKLLEKEKEVAINTLDAQNLAMGIDWGTAFSGIGNVLTEAAKETLKQVEEYMKTAEFKGLSAESKKSYVDLRGNLRKETGGDETSPFNFKQWDVIAKQVTSYQQSVQRLQVAQKLHTQALEELKKAEKDLANATDENAKALAQKAVDIAQGKVDVSAGNLKSAESDTNKKKNELNDSTQKAIQGMNNFSSRLNEMSSGSLYGFANGLTKIFQSLGGSSKEAANGLAGLGKVGGIVGAILQILEALGDNPKQFIEDLLKSVADAISNLISDLPSIVVSVLEGVVDIIGGLIGGIGSWFGLSNVGESDKTLQRDIERLTASNDNLRNALDELSEKLEGSSVTEATSIYNEQVANLKAVIRNTQEMMIRSAEAYSKGFLGIGGTHSSAYYVDKGMQYQDWGRISKIVGQTVNSASDFFNLTSEKMALVAIEATDLYSKIEALADDGHKNASQYMDEYIQYYKQLQELENDYREKVTGVSFESLKDDFKSLLLDMESDAGDFAKSFETMMKNAIVEAFVLKDYKTKLQNFYKNFSDAMESGGTIDEGEQNLLKKEWERYVDEAIKQRDALWATMGWDKSTYDQEASSKGFQAMSQDTGDELNGRFTALQIAGEEIKKQSEQQTALQTLISSDTSEIRQNTAALTQYVSEIVDIQYESVGYLSEISKNTKQLFQMNERLGRIEENTRNM